jgi:hypothetical protein
LGGAGELALLQAECFQALPDHERYIHDASWACLTA